MVDVRNFLAKRINPNLWYICLDKQVGHITYKLGGEILKSKFLVQLTASDGTLLSRKSKDQMMILFNQLKSLYPSDKDIIKEKNKIINLFKLKFDED